MEIIKFEKLNKNEYKLYFANGKEITLYDDIILNYDLLITKKINSSILNKIIKENDEKKAYFLALKKINRKMQTEYEIKKFLESKDISENVICNIIKDLNKQKYLDDSHYVETYINDSIRLSNNGPLKIKKNLLSKGIKSSIIDSYLNKINDEVWIDKTKKIIDKKSLVSKDSKYIFTVKMSNYLKSLGYLSEYFTCNFDNININTKNNFKEKSTKEWTKLSKKYKDKELIYKFKNSMYQKGFSMEEINNYLEEIT